jgi:hypothetical protein
MSRSDAIQAVNIKHTERTKLSQNQYSQEALIQKAQQTTNAEIVKNMDSSKVYAFEVTTTTIGTTAASKFSAEVQTSIENLIKSSNDIMQIIFLVLLSSSDSVTAQLAQAANTMTQLKDVSNNLSTIALGMEEYYNFLTKATLKNDASTPLNTANGDYNLTYTSLTSTYKDANGNTYDLSNLKKALTTLGGLILPITGNDNEQAEKIKKALERIGSIVNTSMTQVTWGTANEKLVEEDAAYFSNSSNTGIYDKTNNNKHNFNNTNDTTANSTVLSQLQTNLISLANDLTTGANSASSSNTTTNAQLNALQSIFQQIFSSASNTLKILQDISNAQLSKIN